MTDMGLNKQKKCQKFILVKSMVYNSIFSFGHNSIFFVKILTGKHLCICLTLVATSLATTAEPSATIRKELPYSSCFEKTAKTYKLDSNWLKAIAIVESSLNPKAVSKSNAIGLMQIKWPITATHLGVSRKDSLFDPCTNIDLGGKYLRELTDKYDGDQENALSAYRVGPTTLAKKGSETAVIMAYKRKVKEQLSILGGHWPSPSQKVNAKAKIERSSDSKKVSSSKKSAQPDLQLASNRTSALKNKPKPPQTRPVCDIKALQLATLSTHHPTTREKEFFKWLQQNGSVCSEGEMLLVANQLPVWLGAGDSKRIRQAVDELMNTISESNPT
tara:strand:- start:1426 stop:2418 length:993 start_codon:yes stop_codon:yes gene_type:complete